MSNVANKKGSLPFKEKFAIQELKPVKETAKS
jgi:hypothetical protein